jgi:integrase
MSKRRRAVNAPRMYHKRQNADGQPYFYGDFRMWRDVGGKQEALKPRGAKDATTDPTEAQALFAARLLELQEARRTRAAQPEDARTDGDKYPARLGPAFVLHLERCAAKGDISQGTLQFYEKCAKRLVRKLGNVRLDSITPAMLTRFVERRRMDRDAKTGKGIAVRTIRNELHTLSNLLERAVATGAIVASPFAMWQDKPAVKDQFEQSFLTRAQGRTLLAAAEKEDARVAELRRLHIPGARTPDDRAIAPIGPRAHTFHSIILALFLYTGGRLHEVLGLAVGDVDLVRNVVMIQDNGFRTLKRKRHRRPVPIPPPIIERLRRHIDQLPNRTPEAALLPGPFGKPMGTIKKLLERCVARAGLSSLGISAHSLRHTFATAMMQTYAEVAPGVFALRNNSDVAALLGHKNSKLVDEVYAHWLVHPEYEETLDFEPPSAKRASASAGVRIRPRSLGVTAPSSGQVHRRESGMPTSSHREQQPARSKRQRRSTMEDPRGYVSALPRVAERLD